MIWVKRVEVEFHADVGGAVELHPAVATPPLKCLSGRMLNRLSLYDSMAVERFAGGCRCGRPRTATVTTAAGFATRADLTDEEWSQVAPLIPPGKRGGSKRRVNVREVINGLMYILSTGCQWRAIPKGPSAAQHAA